MMRLDAGDLFSAQLIAPISDLPAAEERRALPTRRFDEASLLFLLPQLREMRKRYGAIYILLRRGKAGEGQSAVQSPGGIVLQIFITNQVDRDVLLIEPARDMFAPAAQFLPHVSVQPVDFC